MKRMCIVSAFAALAIGCGDDDPAPIATVISASPDVLDPSRDDADDLSIIVEYSDADGDLGQGSAQVIDCRASDVVILYDIPPIANEQAIADGVPIVGELELIVNDVGEIELDSRAPTVCEELGVEDPTAGQVTFCVVLTDAGGNEGVGDCTAAVAIEAS